MGDKSPKAVHKNAKQKQDKAAIETERKRQTIAAKQVPSKKP